jgi:hypothetical protein
MKLELIRARSADELLRRKGQGTKYYFTNC